MKMKKFRILAIVLAIVTFSACFVGCKKKDSGNVIKIAVEAKGYGDEHVKALIEQYNAQTKGAKAELVRSTPTAGFHVNQLGLGASKCDIDLFFTLTNSVFSTQSKSGGNKWADLSDVYNAVAVGYAEADGKKTYKDLLDPTYVEYFTYADGKQYSIPYTSGAVGLIYNKTVWDRTNSNLAGAGKAELVLPKTTDEMFKLFDRIKTQDVKNASGNAYAFSYAGAQPYTHFMFNSLWPQYLGEQASLNFLQGKDENGVYTADIYKTDARLYSYEVVRKMILQEKGYVNTDDAERNYSAAQIEFLRGASIFSINGDWLERETASTVKPGEADIAMLRTPVMSKIVKNEAISADFTGSDATNDAKLSSIIAFIDEHYLDGNGTPSEADATSLGIRKTTLDFIYHARRVRHALVDFVVVAPEYSNQLEGAKDFLKFMYSKQGQDIVLQKTYGCGAPLQVNYSQMSYYANATYYSKNRLDLISKSIAYGNANNYPMQYLGSFRLYPAEGNFTQYFGTTNPSTARDLMMYEYNQNAGGWADKMAQAGVSNS